MKRFAAVLLVPAIAIFMSCRSQTSTDVQRNQVTVRQNADRAEIKVEEVDRSEIQIALEGAEVPLLEELPADVPIFKNATVISTKIDDEQLMVAFQTSSPPKAVIRFYEKELAANDWQIIDRARVPQGAFFMADKADKRSVSVAIGELDKAGALITLTLDAPQK
ncbi:MAG: hypothetical protein AAGE59_05720 [Cyanobacteria bacterium P01_F01_bin.86]